MARGNPMTNSYSRFSNLVFPALCLGVEVTTGFSLVAWEILPHVVTSHSVHARKTELDSFKENVILQFPREGEYQRNPWRIEATQLGGFDFFKPLGVHWPILLSNFVTCHHYSILFLRQRPEASICTTALPLWRNRLCRKPSRILHVRRDWRFTVL